MWSQSAHPPTQALITQAPAAVHVADACGNAGQSATELQPQPPSKHAYPTAASPQDALHAPQLFGSFDSSTQPPPQVE
jgi:hypothetical protein